MIGPKRVKQTRRARADAYELATLRDDDTCQRCGRDCGPTARDHRQNRDPFNTVVENLQCLGLRCHLWKGANPDEANRTGWGVPTWANPAEYPAQRWTPTTHGTRQLEWILYVPDTDYFTYPTGYRVIGADEALARIAAMWDGAID